MSHIKANCAVCGEINLLPFHMWLTVYTNDAKRNYFRFSCPTCGDKIIGVANGVITHSLLSCQAAGLNVETITLPAECLEEHVGAALTYDEVLDFALALDATDFPADLDPLVL